MATPGPSNESEVFDSEQRFLKLQKMMEKLTTDTSKQSQKDELAFGPSTTDQKKRATASPRGKQKFRIASWNLQVLSEGKAAQHLMETVFKIITENEFSIVAVQEVMGEKALETLCKNLNAFCEKIKKPHKWEHKVSEKAGNGFQNRPEHLGFLYNTSRGIEAVDEPVLLTFTKAKVEKKFKRAPAICEFKINEKVIGLVNVHLAADITAKNEVDFLSEIVNSWIGNKYIILGDFNLEPSGTTFEKWLASYQIRNTVKTNISVDKPQGDKNYDNIWLQDSLSKELMDIRGSAVTKELKCANCETYVSDHCPVYIEFYI